MKIRIKGDSLRYRLTRTDIERLATDGYLEEITSFGQQSLIYSLECAAVSQLHATFQNNKISLFMPYSMAEEWATTDRVGFENNADKLYLLIEKDFKCLDEVAEDQSDNYPNPQSYKNHLLY